MTRKFKPVPPIEDVLFPVTSINADWYNERIIQKAAAQIPRTTRLQNWLTAAHEKPIRINCEGGVPYDKDLRALVAIGDLKLSRTGTTSFRGPACRNRTTTLELTAKGMAKVK